MLNRMDPEARRALAVAHDEARALRHGYLATEHILLGLLADPDSLASRGLRAVGATSEAVRAQVWRLVRPGVDPDEAASGELPLTPRARKALELALEEARGANSSLVRPEHLLLGITGETGGVAARVLRELDADVGRIREALRSGA